MQAGSGEPSSQSPEVREPLFLGRMIAPDTPVSAAGTENAMRVQAYSQVMAMAAEREVKFVKQFRHTHLPEGKVLPLARLFAWLVERAVEDGAPTDMLTGVPWEILHPQEDGSYLLPKDWADVVRRDLDAHERWEILVSIASRDPLDWLDPPRLTRKRLWVLMPTSDQDAFYAESVDVRLGGVLDELRKFTVEFPSDKYWMWRDDPDIVGISRQRWDKARIATFVLTGYVPLLSEKQVPPPSGRGSRVQTVKNLQLAVFSVQHASEPLRIRMETWNTQYPEWAYKQTTSFGWDSLQSVRRLLNQPTVRLDAPSKAFGDTVAQSIDRTILPKMGVGVVGERILDWGSRELMEEIVQQMAARRSKG